MQTSKLILSWDDYPAPRLKARNGVWDVRVSIPSKIKFLYSDGATERRRSTQTSDKKIAERRQIIKCHEIYNDFDKKQIEFLNTKQKKQRNDEQWLDEEARLFIIDLAKGFRIKPPNGGDVYPFLTPNEPFADMLRLKDQLDAVAHMVRDAEPEREDIRTWKKSRKATGESALLDQYPDFTYGFNKRLLAARYLSSTVRFFWEDLLIQAAQQQGLKPPDFHEAGIDDFWQPDDLDVVVRPRRNKPTDKKMSNLLDGWDARVDRDYKKGATVRKLKRSIRKFMTLVGDLEVDEVRPTHGFAFADALLAQNPQYSRQSLRDYVSFCGSFFNMYVEQGLIDANPFNRLNLKQRGREKANWLPFTKDELHRIFNYEWDEQLRLLLSILVTTGMRLEEAVALTWDRYNDTEHQGIRYFSLISTGFEEVDVKTESSVRYVLLHPDLKLPLKQDTGRLFTFAHNVAGSLINPVLRDLFNNPRKRTHSFRRSFKIMYRDQGVEERSIDALVGHGEGDASRQAYAGVGVPKRFEMLCKLEHPWLKQDVRQVHPT